MGPTLLLVFRVSDQRFGLPATVVQEIFHLPLLITAPLLPPALAGFVNLAGVAAPVVRLDRLLALPEEDLHLYTPLLWLKGARPPIVLAVHAVVEATWTAEEQWLGVESGRSFNGCVKAEVPANHGSIHLLSTDGLLLEEERQRLAAFQGRIQERLLDLEPGL